MNYIIIDLEWNQCPQGKEKENPQLPFEIIEIGAVKMDESKRVIDTFSALINPQVYQRIHHRTMDIIGVRIAQLRQAQPFPVVIKDFLNWCGTDYMFCTWGSMDLAELQRNMQFFNVKNPFKKPLFFYDVQKLYSLLYGDGKVRISLQGAAKALGLDIDAFFHRALNDAYYTAEIMKHMNLDLVKEYESVDYFRPPSNKKEEINIVFRRYAKYVSRTFTTKEEALCDKTVLSSRCYQCSNMLRKTIRWFPVSQKQYLCLAYCPQHGWLKGKIRIKKTDSGEVFVIKTLKLVEKPQADAIKVRKEEVRRKQRERRKHIREIKRNLV